MSGSLPASTWRVVPLGPDHDRSDFNCGNAALDRYLRVQAGQDLRRHAASVFVAEDPATRAIAGYYSLSMAAVRLERLPPEVARQLPRYPQVPAVRLGRLAVHRDARGQGLGSHLLMDAIARSLRSEVAWVALVVDAKDEAARAFYLRFGFCAFLDDPLHLWLQRQTLAQLPLRPRP